MRAPGWAAWAAVALIGLAGCGEAEVGTGAVEVERPGITLPTPPSPAPTQPTPTVDPTAPCPHSMPDVDSGASGAPADLPFPAAEQAWVCDYDLEGTLLGTADVPAGLADRLTAALADPQPIPRDALCSLEYTSDTVFILRSGAAYRGFSVNSSGCATVRVSESVSVTDRGTTLIYADGAAAPSDALLDLLPQVARLP